jgi:protein-tyrosine phosphatase
VRKRVLIVCHANTARSVMAQKLIERMLGERGLGDRVHVSSAGVWTYARDGMIPSLDARLALREVGIELAEDGMASTALREHPEILASADLVVTMTAEQTALVRTLANGRGIDVVTLPELAGETGDIADPAGGGEEAFRAARDEIMRCLVLGFDRMVTLALGRGAPGPD